MKKFEPPLWVDVKQSKYLLVFIITVHGLAVLSSLFLAILIPLKLIVLSLVCVSLYFHLRRYQQSFYQFTIKHTSEFAWEIGTSSSLDHIYILSSSVLTSFVIILHVQIDNKYQNRLICRDAVPAEEYRQLLVALKITAIDGSNSGS